MMLCNGFISHRWDIFEQFAYTSGQTFVVENVLNHIWARFNFVYKMDMSI